MNRWRTRHCSIVSNTQDIVIHTNFTGTAKQIITITLDNLLTMPDGLQKLRNIFCTTLKPSGPKRLQPESAEEAAAFLGPWPRT